MPVRLSAAFAGSSVILAPWILGLSEVWSARIVLLCLEATGLERVIQVGPVRFAVGTSGYEIDFWCTPSVLPLCGIALLWFARQRACAYLATCIAFTIACALLIFASAVLSVHLHQGGIDWVWAHYPGAILVYTGTLIWCVMFAEARQRKLRQNALETPAARLR